jgi:hypothetical protein
VGERVAAIGGVEGDGGDAVAVLDCDLSRHGGDAS